MASSGEEVEHKHEKEKRGRRKWDVQIKHGERVIEFNCPWEESDDLEYMYIKADFIPSVIKTSHLNNGRAMLDGRETDSDYYPYISGGSGEKIHHIDISAISPHNKLLESATMGDVVFGDERLASILNWMHNKGKLPPITVCEKSNGYSVVDGVHRLVASILFGYTEICACFQVLPDDFT